MGKKGTLPRLECYLFVVFNFYERYPNCPGSFVGSTVTEMVEMVVL